MWNLIATLMASVLGLLYMVTAAQQMSRVARQIKLVAAAQEQKQYASAVQGYLRQYYATVQSSTPATITTAMLTSTGFLPSGFNPHNAYGQAWSTYVTQPTSGNLEAMVYTAGGDWIDQDDAPLIAALSGPGGGYMTYGRNNPAGNFIGAYGSYAVPWASVVPANPGAGHLASLLYFNAGSLVSPDGLYRVGVPGHPELNQMQVNLDLGNNQGKNASQLQSNGAVVAGGVGVPSTGEPLVAHGANSGVSMDDRAAGNPRWSVYPWLGTLSYWNDTWGTTAEIDTWGDVKARGYIAPSAAGGGNGGATLGGACPQYGAINANNDNSSGVLQCAGPVGALTWQAFKANPTVLSQAKQDQTSYSCAANNWCPGTTVQLDLPSGHNDWMLTADYSFEGAVYVAAAAAQSRIDTFVYIQPGTCGSGGIGGVTAMTGQWITNPYSSAENPLSNVSLGSSGSMQLSNMSAGGSVCVTMSFGGSNAAYENAGDTKLILPGSTLLEAHALAMD